MVNALKIAQVDNSAYMDEIAALKGAVKYYRNKFIQVDADNRDLGTHIRDLTAENYRLRASKRPAEEDPKHETLALLWDTWTSKYHGVSVNQVLIFMPLHSPGTKHEPWLFTNNGYAPFMAPLSIFTANRDASAAGLRPPVLQSPPGASAGCQGKSRSQLARRPTKPPRSPVRPRWPQRPSASSGAP